MARLKPPLRARMNHFARVYCAQRNLPESAYARSALRACLHWPARLLYRPITLVAPNFFSADLDLINGAGWLTRPQDMDFEFESYRFHPFNQSRWRHRLGLALSTRKTHRLVWRTLRAHAPVPAAPELAPPPPPPTPLPALQSTPPAPVVGTAAVSREDPFAAFPLRELPTAKP